MDKKHEDVGGVAQIDKTSVFQEGTPPGCAMGSLRAELEDAGADTEHSTSIQPESHIASEMQSGA